MTKVFALVHLTQDRFRKNRRKGETFPFLNKSWVKSTARKYLKSNYPKQSINSGAKQIHPLAQNNRNTTRFLWEFSLGILPDFFWEYCPIFL